MKSNKKDLENALRSIINMTRANMMFSIDEAWMERERTRATQGTSEPTDLERVHELLRRAESQDFVKDAAWLWYWRGFLTGIDGNQKAIELRQSFEKAWEQSCRDAAEEYARWR